MRRPEAGTCCASLLMLGAWCAAPALLAIWLAPAWASLLSFGSAVALLLATRTTPVRRAGAWRATFGFAAAALAGAFALPAWQRGVWHAGALLGLGPSAFALARGVPAADPAIWLAVGCMGPWAEELLFRERLLFALRGVWPGIAALASALLFALPHLAPWSVLGAFLLGLWLVVLVRSARSLLLCVGYHVGINVACLVSSTPTHTRVACLLALLASHAALGSALRAMRAPRASQAAAAGLAALLAAASAAGGVQEFTATLTLDPFLTAIPPVSISGVGVATLNGAGQGVALETLSVQGGVAGTATVPVTDPVVSNGGLTALRVQARQGEGRLRPFQPIASSSAPQLTAATLPLQGMARMCLLASCSFGLDMPLAATTPQGVVGIGVGGAISLPLGSFRRTVLGAPWTLRTASVELSTSAGGQITAYASGFAHGPYSFTGSTAQTGGSVQLVTPFVVRSPSAFQPPTGFARLTLHFVPEPRALFVLAPSIALLAAGARRRRRRGGSS